MYFVVPFYKHGTHTLV